MQFILTLLIAFVIGYLLGSIPFALVIGKLFYHTDVREHGSGNLGGTNTGRVLGAKAGITVIVFDILKVVLAVWLASFFNPYAAIVTGFACCIGHIFPVFAGFRGGKAVATMFGYLLSLSLFVLHNMLYFLGPAIFFLLVLYLFRWVSLASITSAICSSVQITSMNFGYDSFSLCLMIVSWILTAIVIIKHASNIKNIRLNRESRILEKKQRK